MHVEEASEASTVISAAVDIMDFPIAELVSVILMESNPFQTGHLGIARYLIRWDFFVLCLILLRI